MLIRYKRKTRKHCTMCFWWTYSLRVKSRISLTECGKPTNVLYYNMLGSVCHELQWSEIKEQTHVAYRNISHVLYTTTSDRAPKCDFQHETNRVDPTRCGNY